MNNIKLVNYVKQARSDDWGYVGGGNGELYTKELAQHWADTRSGHPDSYYLNDCARWIGHKVADCSGLIISALRSENPNYQDQTANTLFSRCKRTGNINTIPEIPGLCVWKRGHIGVYIGNGYAIEARGYKYGVVLTRVKDRPWTNWGMLRDVDYDNLGEIIEGGDEIMWQKGDKGNGVAFWQGICRELGFGEELGTFGPKKDGIDDDFGSATESATKAVQKKLGLPQTGKADGMTVAKAVEAARKNDASTTDLNAALAKIAAAKKALA